MGKVMKYSCMIFGTGLLLFLWAIFSGYGSDKTSKLASFDIPGPHNRQLIVYTSDYYEISISCYYVITEGGVNITIESYFHGLAMGGGGSTLRVSFSKRKNPFRLLSADNGNMIALVDMETPTVLRVIHDFTTGASFPYKSDDTLTHQECHRLDKLLYHKFCKAIGDDKYVLGSEYTGAENNVAVVESIKLLPVV